ncbi:MAG: M14 family zinc carboxypeptidase [Traorella sp.]
MKIDDVLNLIPDLHEFMSVDEMDESTFALEKKYPDKVKVDQVGESRNHHPIYRLQIGKGKRKALIFGCPHPNEPIGAMMIEQLTRILCENDQLLEQLDTTFHFIKCVDPDGLKLNEGWLKGPFTYENYATHFYRPASDEQVEWTFPFDYKNYSFHHELSETKAIMKVMDEVKPDFMYSLHNSSFGGVYWYVTKEKEFIQRFPVAAKRQNLPLNLGEPETPFCKIYQDAIYELPQLKASYDFYEANLGKDPSTFMKGGGCSVDYLDTLNPNAFGLVCEMPYFYCPDSNDLSNCENLTRKEAILEGFKRADVYLNKLKEAVHILEKYADKSNRCMSALLERVNDNQEHRDAQLANMQAHPDEYETICSKASLFDNLLGTPWYTLIAFGMVITVAKEIMKQDPITELEELIHDCENFVHEECLKLDREVPCTPIEIKKLVSVQMESALIALGMD